MRAIVKTYYVPAADSSFFLAPPRVLRDLVGDTEVSFLDAAEGEVDIVGLDGDGGTFAFGSGADGVDGATAAGTASLLLPLRTISAHMLSFS